METAQAKSSGRERGREGEIERKRESEMECATGVVDVPIENRHE